MELKFLKTARVLWFLTPVLLVGFLIIVAVSTSITTVFYARKAEDLKGQLAKEVAAHQVLKDKSICLTGLLAIGDITDADLVATQVASKIPSKDIYQVYDIFTYHGCFGISLGLTNGQSLLIWFVKENGKWRMVERWCYEGC